MCVDVVCREEFETIGEARAREKFFTSAAGRRYLAGKESMRP